MNASSSLLRLFARTVSGFLAHSWILLTLSSTACSSETQNPGKPDASAEAGAAGASSGDAGASGGSGGQGTLDCTGTFGNPERLLSVASATLRAPAVTADELELFYVEAESEDGPESFMQSIRSSKSESFPPPRRVEALNAACADRPIEDVYGIDVSPDGRDAYVTCQSTNELNEIRVLTRADRASPFEAAGSIGQAGSSVSIGFDGLVAFSSGYEPYPSPPLTARRSSAADPFGMPMPVAGVESVLLVAPDLAPDGLTLYGAAGGNELGFVRRRSGAEPFADFEAIAVGQLTAAGAPEISADCRTLYFVGIEPAEPNDAGVRTSVWGIYGIRR